MVIPSFSAFAGTPNLAAAYTGGAHLGLEQQRIQQATAQAGAEIQLQHEKLAQQQQQNEMELASKEKAQTAQMLRQQQEMEIEKAYKEATIGLHQRELAQSAQKLQMATEQAARKFQAQQNYRQFMDENPDKFMEGISKFGPEMGASSGAYTAASRSEAARHPFIPEMKDVGGIPMVHTSPERWQVAPQTKVPQAATGAVINSLTRRLQANQRDIAAISSSPVSLKANAPMLESLKADNAALAKQLDSYTLKAALPPGMTNGTGSTKSSPYKEGQIIRSKKDGKQYKVVNGEPVSMEEGDDGEDY